MKSPARRAARMPMLRSGCMTIGARITEHGLPGSHRAHRPESSRQCRLGGARHEEHGARRPHAGAPAVVSAPRIERARGGCRRHPGEGARGGQRRRGDRRLRLRRRHDLASALVLLGIHHAARGRPRASSGSARRIARRCCSARSATVSAPRISTIATCWCASRRIPRIARSTSPCRCSCSRTSCSWRASSRNRTCSSSSRSRRSGDVEHFYSHLHQVLNEIDFEDRTGHLMERLRRLFNRAQLDRNELNILRGILSAVQGRRGQSVRRPRE